MTGSPADVGIGEVELESIIRIHRNRKNGVPLVAQRVKNLTSIHENVGSISGLAHWVKDPSSLWPWHIGWQLQLQFEL